MGMDSVTEMWSETKIRKQKSTLMLSENEGYAVEETFPCKNMTCLSSINM